MKRYILFACYEYSNDGGWHSFKGSFDELGDAKEMLAQVENYDFWHIVDSKIAEIVVQGGRK